MNIRNKAQYISHSIKPSRNDTYLVKTFEGCYDFAHWNGSEWSTGNITDGRVYLYTEIPQTEQSYQK